jgi:hypothetical protein
MKNPEFVNNYKPLILQLRFDPIKILVMIYRCEFFRARGPIIPKNICLLGIHTYLYLSFKIKGFDANELLRIKGRS